MESLRPNTQQLFLRELEAMSLAISEVSRLANSLKGLHEADVKKALDVRKALDDNLALTETDKMLCQEMRLLKDLHEEDRRKASETKLPLTEIHQMLHQESELLTDLQNTLPHRIAWENDETTTEAKDAGAPAHPGDHVESFDLGATPLAAAVASDACELRTSLSIEPPAEPAESLSFPSAEPPELPERSVALERSLACNPLRSSQSDLPVREVWLEAKDEMTKTCQGRLSFTIAERCDIKRSPTMSLPRSERRVKATCGMHPVGGPRIVWNCLCLLAIMYDLMFIPLQAFDLGESTVFDVCEWFLTFLWTSDLFMTFRTGYFIGSKLEMRQKPIAIHYAKTWLLVDLMIVVLEWMGRFLKVTSSASLLRSTRASRNIMGVVKLIRLTKMNSLWASILEQINSNVFELCWTLVCICISMLVLVHFTSCIWYAMGDGAADGWTSYEAYEGSKDFLFWYIASARWVISQMNGRTDMHEKRNMPERLFTCIIGILLAVIAQALFVSIITKTMISLSELVSEKTRTRRLVNDYLAVHRLPPILTSQVRRCLYEYQDTNVLTKKEEAVLSVLPSFLQTSVLYEVRAPVVMKNTLFHTLCYESPFAMRLICHQVLQPVPVSKGEVVFDKGDACTRMLFMDVLSATYADPDEVGAFELDMSATRSNLSVRHTKRKFSVSSNQTTRTATPYSRTSSRLSRTVVRTVQTIRAGHWVSEPSLWTLWRNQGRLVADVHGVMLGAHFDDLANALTKHRDALAMAAMYAETFVEHLRLQEDLSDVIDFEVITLAPVSLLVEVISATGIAPERGMLFETTPDVYCVCKVTGLTGSNGEVRFTTPGVSDICNPVWSYGQHVHISRHQSFVFEVWSDILVAEVRIDPEDFLPNGFAGDRQVSSGEGFITINVQVEESNGAAADASLYKLSSPFKN